MRKQWQYMAHLFFYIAVILVFASAEASLWHQFFGQFPSPIFWLPPLIYLFLRRPFAEGIIFAYIICVVISVMTSVPLGILLWSILALAIAFWIFKQRFYWPGPGYFMLATGSAVVMFHLFRFLASLFIEEMPIITLPWFDWLIQILLTPLLAPPVFQFMSWFDRITNKDQITEAALE